MSQVQPDQVEAQLSYELVGVSDTDAFFDATSAMLAAVFHCDGVVWNHLDLDTPTAQVRGTPVELQDEHTSALLAHHAPDHPIIRSYLATEDLSPRRMSDLSTRQQLLNTGCYVEVFRPLGIHFLLSVVTTRSGRMTGGGWALSRELHDFTDDDVAVATRIQTMLSLLTYQLARPPTAPSEEAEAASGLTKRELQVLGLVADGHTAHAVAGLLRIAPATVRKHLERVYTKLDSHDRLLAVCKAERLGLLSRGGSQAE